MTLSRRRGSLLGATLCTLVVVMMAPAAAHAEVTKYIGLEAYNSVGRAAEFSGGAARIVFVSQTEASVDGHLYDLSFDGWCALVSMTVNDGSADAYTVRREKCGFDPAYGKFVEHIFVKPRVYNIKVAVGIRYPHTRQIRWGESVKYANPYW